MNDAYVQGFMAKCAEAGVDPVALLKSACPPGVKPMAATAASKMRGGSKVRLIDILKSVSKKDTVTDLSAGGPAKPPVTE